MSSIESLKADLRGAAAERDPAERGVKIASVVAEAMRGIGQDPVLVGGAAVEFYTKGGYSTSDIDMIAPGGAELADLMGKLGFDKIGKDYADRQNNIYIEFPGSFLADSESFVELTVEGRVLRIVSPEDLIVDRLCAFKFWKSAVDGVNALLVEEMAAQDLSRLKDRAREEGVEDALALVHEVREKAIRERLSRVEASRLLESGMRKLKK